MNPSTTTVSNGVNVEALLGARAALSETPEAARFKWRATSEWVRGTHSRATLDGFFGLGGEQKHRQPFDFDTDHPEIFASEDKGATPVEMVLVGLAGCLSAGIAAVAEHRKIQLRSVKATLEAGMDLQGILGIDEKVRNGFDGIQVHFEIDADATPEQIAALVAQSQKRSAVFDILTNPTDVHVTASKKLTARRPQHAAGRRRRRRHRCRPLRAGDEPCAVAAFDRPRRARTRRGGERLAHRTLGLAAAAHAELDDAAARPRLRRRRPATAT